ncbi:restriction endonuclease subunit S [Actinoplanes utahensis]|uniref:restriction endonuclease subunit S n=1 Tax=Actinoplanes utahensis TaxID=1869 RepID=UPI000689342D|nr:restriction endonuclease subunit S [Actinoplanes utahensis]GIF30460.1 restriction modification system S chain-like protein [Actinoplanes utahensis]
MRTARIGEVVRQVRTWDPRTAPDGCFRYIDLGAIDQRTKRITGDRTVPSAAAPSRARQLVRAGDVLVPLVRPNLNGVALVGDDLDGATASTGFCVLRPGGRLDSRYLFHWVRTPRFVAALTGRATGQSYPAVSDRAVRELEIPLPGRSEQERIAARLSRADGLRDRRGRAGELLDTLVPAIFTEMFGAPEAVPGRWARKPLGALVSMMSDGPFGSDLKTAHYAGSGVRVVRLQNIGAGEFADHDRAYVSEEHFATLRRHPCLPGDVLVATLGDPAPRACVQPSWLDRALNKADCVQVRVDPAVATPEYVCAALNMPGTVAGARRLRFGQTRARISMGRLRTLEIPVPPLPAQAEFSRRAAVVGALLARHRAAVAETDDLYAALRDQAFSG